MDINTNTNNQVSTQETQVVNQDTQVNVVPTQADVQPKEQQETLTETKTDDTTVNTTDNEIVEWKETGDKQVDTIGKLVTKANMKPESLIEELLEHNDFTKETIEKLEAKHGKEVTDMLLKEVKDLHQKNIEKIEADNQGVYDTMSDILGIDKNLGKEGWKELSEWASVNIEEGIRNDLSKLLQQGGLAAKLAAREIAEFYVENTRGKQDAKQKPETVKGVPDGSGDKFISRNEFLERKRELESKYGLDSPEVKRLREQRRRSINAGYE